MQLNEYLRLYPEGQFRAEAETAAADLRELEAGYYLGLANYYKRIEVPEASARYLELARGFEGTVAAAEASSRLQALSASTAPNRP